MARLFWMIVMLAVVAGIATGISWIGAYVAVGKLLGSPPPEMGAQKTTLHWKGIPHYPGHPRAWEFDYSPTRIPGAERVEIYVSPKGEIIGTDPPDLPARIKAFHWRVY